MTVDRLNELLLACSLVLLVAVAAVRLTSRTGLPSLLLYLAIGIALGHDGLGIEFSDVKLTQLLGYAALVVILAEGGLSTRWSDIRPAIPAAAVLATVGVGISVGVTAAGAHYLLGLSWQTALVLGAVVSSTDAAAIFSVLRRVPLPHYLTGVLEAESGFNDAPVVILVVAFSAHHPHPGDWPVLIGEIALELLIGLGLGLLVGRIGALALRGVALPAFGLYPIAVLALIVVAYATAALLHGSGFLAAYVSALVLGNAALPHRPSVRGFADAVAWVAQIGLFVLLGLLVDPAQLWDDIGPALLVGGVLTLLARPLSVVIGLWPFRRPWRERALVSWAGLRGAVPIVLAIIPVVEGVEDSRRIFGVVFVLVIVFTLLQGPTLPWLARRLRLGDGEQAVDVNIESAPLERLRGYLLSVTIPPASRMHGVEIAELRLPREAAVTLVVREGRSFVPEPSTMLRRGDELLVVATDAVREAVERRLVAVGRGGKLVGWLGADGEPRGPGRQRRRPGGARHPGRPARREREPRRG
ncbi:potassium/proton antiporter [Streptomyces hoynatensis]|uniref:Potassium/proton antiporter n=1 Tax=Streptomyces hoynatensis TaxID=1141874 RepID=A0A3A9Z2H1_9ACTN|nr:potassium/proton antiporter [Streptomyces hoynatensis]RKN41616.1 potassium/proton antiporter [Streptomyces hoynatensis]